MKDMLVIAFFVLVLGGVIWLNCVQRPSEIDDWIKAKGLTLVEKDQRILSTGPYWIVEDALIYRVVGRDQKGQKRVFWFRWWLGREIKEEVNGKYITIE